MFLFCQFVKKWTASGAVESCVQPWPLDGQWSCGELGPAVTFGRPVREWERFDGLIHIMSHREARQSVGSIPALIPFILLGENSNCSPRFSQTIAFSSFLFFFPLWSFFHLISPNRKEALKHICVINMKCLLASPVFQIDINMREMQNITAELRNTSETISNESDKTWKIAHSNPLPSCPLVSSLIINSLFHSVMILYTVGYLLHI